APALVRAPRRAALERRARARVVSKRTARASKREVRKGAPEEIATIEVLEHPEPLLTRAGQTRPRLREIRLHARVIGPLRIESSERLDRPFEVRPARPSQLRVDPPVRANERQREDPLCTERERWCVTSERTDRRVVRSHAPDHVSR